MPTIFKKVVLVILDGLGVASAAPGNAVTRAGMSTLNRLVNTYPSLALQAAGPNVGLPWGEPGNSEVGHMCMGAGRIVLQDLPRIDQAISTKAFYQTPAFLRAIEHAKERNSALHLVGLLGMGGVHASQLHLYALLSLCAQHGLSRVYIHAITDGRDTEPDAALKAVRDLEKEMLRLGVGTIVSLTGRFFAMDRGEHWDLTELAYRALVLGQGEIAHSPLQAVESYYSQNIFDETIPPTVIVPSQGKPVTIQNSDAIILFNFRPDRVRQLTRAFLEADSVGFAHRYKRLSDVAIATMTEYDQNFPVEVGFPQLAVRNTLSEVLAAAGKRQYHVAELEKYQHVTYFFGSGQEQPLQGEVWDKVSSSTSYQDRYQNVPQMSAPELTSKLISQLGQPYEFYLANYANPDMVGHTGNVPASLLALQAVDASLQAMVEEGSKHQDMLIVITADHGNIEQVQEIYTGRTHTSHTTNPIPLILVAPRLALPRPRKNGYLFLATQTPEGLLSDIAPTILAAFGLSKPEDMSGISLWPILERQIHS